MSLAIDPASVRAVLLADGWHTVKQGTFDLDAYEYIEPGENGRDGFTLHGGGNSGVCATGFSFLEVERSEAGLHDLGRISGPLTALLAVSH